MVEENEKAEAFRHVLQQDLEKLRSKRKLLEGVSDISNSLPVMVQELQLRNIIDQFNFYWPEARNNFK